MPFSIDRASLKIPDKPSILSAEEIREDIAATPLKVVCATVGEDEHSVGMREIIDIKHGGIEGFGVKATYLGTSVPIDKVVNAAIEEDADAILISTIISHADIHRKNMERLASLCQEKGVRDKFILVGGGTQVTNDLAVQAGLDAGFGRGTKGIRSPPSWSETPRTTREKRRELLKVDVLVAEIGSTTTVVNAFELGRARRFPGAGHGADHGRFRRRYGRLEMAVDDFRKKSGDNDVGDPLMLAASSAAGGLSMSVHGLVYDMTVRAAREAALGSRRRRQVRDRR